MNMIVGSMLGNPLGGGLDKLTGDGDAEGGEKTETGEDPEVVQARIEAEERRKEKHRKMENEREKMRQDIRDKYKIQKKEDGMAAMDMSEGRIGAARKKTPEELAQEVHQEDDTIIGQLGLTEHVEKAKTAVSGAFETVKGFLPFGK